MSVIDKYFSNLNPEQRVLLEHIRNVCIESVPTATEAISYGMPGFKYKKKYLITFAAFKDHYSIFPGAEPVETLRSKLGSYKVSKGTIQFTADNMLTDELVRSILNIRVTSIDSEE
jgi:uncharacterized protein YdhG (YjbR/CyaY superfamily)